jgi:hypothetical protein
MLVYCRKPNCSKFVVADQLAVSHPYPYGSWSKRAIHVFSDQKTESLELGLLEEEPLSIRKQGKPYSVVMRMPTREGRRAYPVIPDQL